MNGQSMTSINTAQMREENHFSVNSNSQGIGRREQLERVLQSTVSRFR